VTAKNQLLTIISAFSPHPQGRMVDRPPESALDRSQVVLLSSILYYPQGFEDVILEVSSKMLK
jgi:hypothetical protein